VMRNACNLLRISCLHRSSLGTAPWIDAGSKAMNVRMGLQEVPEVVLRDGRDGGEREEEASGMTVGWTLCGGGGDGV
jgi:hypothetical protein